MMERNESNVTSPEARCGGAMASPLEAGLILAVLTRAQPLGRAIVVWKQYALVDQWRSLLRMRYNATMCFVDPIDLRRNNVWKRKKKTKGKAMPPNHNNSRTIQ